MAAAEQASLAPSGRVITAKIRPPFAEGWVERPRPEALLSKAVESRRVVVVSATAGAGKTTLVAAVAQRVGRPAAWLTLDWTDTAPGRLVTYLEAALAVVVPRASGVAHEALAARIPHPEAAGLLVEAVAGERVVLVIDELERLRDAAEAWEVIEALLRHAPADMRFVLCSRRPVPASVLPRHPGEVVWLGGEALALTVAEAAAVLEGSGQMTVDPAAAVQATGGWVTGVLFESWRIADQGAGGGHDDPLYSYLSAHILRDLPSEDREFLLTTSVLGEITAARASALGVGDAKARLASLRGAHIPATWSDAGRALRCHPRFREYLQSELETREAEPLRALHVAHGQLLASEGHHDEATEVLLRAGATVEALEPAAAAIFDVINRLDFALAKRWLDALSDVEPEGMSPFVIARLTLAVATENPRLGVEVADRLAAGGNLEEAASSSSMAAWMISYCYVLAGRYDDMLATFALAPHDADYQAFRAFIGIYASDPPPRMPELPGGPLDSVLLPSVYGYGRLARALEISGAGGWMQAFSQPWLIAALRDAGRIQEAVDLYEAVRAHGLAKVSLEVAIGPRVLTDAGRREEALEAIGRGRRLAKEASCLVYELVGRIQEARLFLRLDRDPVAAIAALSPVDRHPFTHRVGVLRAHLNCWCGFALLLAGRDGEALARLRRAVTILRRTRQMLEMPSAAVYLAEAEWRMGNEEAADEAADLALEAAGVQGFNHMLLQALRDFPAVLSRRLDAEPAADSPWHELGRALHAQTLDAEAPARAPVQLREFGRLAIMVEGEEVNARIAKTYELFAYLLTRPHHRAKREELLDVLFDARADDSTRAYLRQAVHRLRSVLTPDAVISDRAAVGLSDHVAAVSESVELERALAQAARGRGADRLAAIMSALEVVDQGPYLPGIDSQWVEDRRQHLRELVTDARYEAAGLALSEGRLQDAERLTEAVLQDEPFHEPAWRLTMRLSCARGDDHGVLRSYQRCERVLADVGAEPSPSTRQLVDQLRR
jgi:DNA-binding SARP family transcriptional activator